MNRTSVIHITIIALLSLGVVPDTDQIFCGDLSLAPTKEVDIIEFHHQEAASKARSLELARRLFQQKDPTAIETQASYNVKYYDIAIRVDDTVEMLYGVVSCLAEAVEDGVSQAVVDLFDNMLVDSISCPSGGLSYVHENHLLTIDLDGAYDTGETFSFSVFYRGPGSVISGIGFLWDWYRGQRSIYSLSCPYFSRVWWPCKDRTDDKADSLSIHIEVDTSLYCASNGSLDSVTTAALSDARTFHYSVHYPIATYLFSVAIAPYVVWQQEYISLEGQDTIPVVNHVFASDYEWSLEEWSGLSQMIGILASEFGEYPFVNERYGHATINWGGGMEHQTMSSIPCGEYGYGWIILAHELAHQWWGDMITCKSWHDIWLNEGWATYSAAVYVKAIDGWSAYHSHMNTMTYYDGGTVHCSDTTDPWRIFNIRSYYKAAWVIHMLRGVVGEAQFASGIEAYYNSEYKYGAITTEEFKNVWENATGRELDAFFEDWIYGEYYPYYHYYFMSEPSDAEGHNTYLVVRQTQTTNPRVFHMPVDFFMDYVSGPDDTVALEIDERRELFKFNQSSPIDTIELDPSDWVLKQVQNLPWEMFIVTTPDELKTGTVAQMYSDTVETRGETGSRLFWITSGYLPPGLSISTEGIISGLPTVSGSYSFLLEVVDVGSDWVDQQEYTLHVLPIPCCHERVGNVDGEGDEEPTIGDISTLIDAKYIRGTCEGVVGCLAEADVNQSGGAVPSCDDITIGDIAILIDYLFITGPETATLLECL